MATVGVVGLGLLGGAVAARLRAGGHVVVGYDVVAEKVQALVELGGRAAPTADAVAEAAEAVCVVLPSLASVDEVVLGPRGPVALSRLVALHGGAAGGGRLVARRAGLDLDLVLDELSRSAATSRMLEVRGPLIARGEFPPQM